MQATESSRWKFKGPDMEGVIARWYAGLRGTASSFATYRRDAASLTQGLPADAKILEVAPGPGYLAIELGRTGRHVAGLDISRTFVEIASDNARREGVEVDFRQGDVAAMPFSDASFDLVVCQAAFKNFSRPATALREMHRVLRPGATAVIDDMSHDASHDEIAKEVRSMGLGRLSSLVTTATLEGLRRRAYTRAAFESLAAESPFATCDVQAAGIGLRVRLTKGRPGA